MTNDIDASITDKDAAIIDIGAVTNDIDAAITDIGASTTDKSSTKMNKTSAKENKDYPLKEFYKKIYGRYDLVNRIFTFGQDRNWRKKAVEECLGNAPQQVLDICTGTGDLVLELAEKAFRTGDPTLEISVNKVIQRKDRSAKDPSEKDEQQKDLFTKDPSEKDAQQKDLFTKDPSEKDEQVKVPIAKGPSEKDEQGKKPIAKGPSENAAQAVGPAATEDSANVSSDQFSSHPLHRLRLLRRNAGKSQGEGCSSRRTN
jgi:hypothetical protein